MKYTHRPGHNRKWHWECVCGVSSFNKTESQAMLAVADHMDKVSARLRKDRPVGFIGILPDQGFTGLLAMWYSSTTQRRRRK